MKFSWFFSGKEYHELKESFKKARGELGKELKFAGFAAMAWYDRDQRIELHADREEDVTKHVTIVWTGREDTELLKWMKEKWEPFSLESDEDENTKRKKQALRRLQAFDAETENKVKHMEERNAPKSFIGYFKNDRGLLRTVLQAEYNCVIGLYDEKDLEIVKKKVKKKMMGRGPIHHI